MKTRKSIRRIALIVIGTLLFVQGQAQHVTTLKLSREETTLPEQVLRVMEKNADSLFAEINRKYDQNNPQLNLSSNVVTEDARKRIVSMWAVSHFCGARTKVIGDVMEKKSDNVYQVREIPVFVRKGEGDTKYMVLEFDRSGKICDMYPAMSEHEYTAFYENGNDVTDTRHREMVQGFVSEFFTAYNLGLKGLDFIEKMYSEGALIITGRVVNYKTDSKNDFSRTLTNDSRIKYSVQSKKEYIAKLKGIFSRNEYININFDGVEIFQDEDHPERYGVRLNQYWHVSHKANVPGYYDEGKLFLIIDFTNEEQPEIWVRTWQPFKDEKGNIIPYTNKDYFNLGDFPFNRE